MGDTSKLCECGHEQAKHEGLNRSCLANDASDGKGWPCTCLTFRPMEVLPGKMRARVDAAVDAILSGTPELPPPPLRGTTGKLIDPAGVDHPSHYNSHPAGVECIDVIEHMPHNIGAAIKYLWRVGLKGDATDAIRDVRKAAWYAERAAKRLEKLRGSK